jgi:PhzF family phenazine biosynthesis protein
MRRPFRQVDVFGAGSISGNPLAVVLDGEGLTSEEMQSFAQWTNLSETTFLLPPTTPEADYRVRIFTLGRELPFAGHPTLGSCHAWLAEGGDPRQKNRIIQECGAGLVTIRHQADFLAFAAPPLIRTGPVEEPLLDVLASVLGVSKSEMVDSQWVSNGPDWVAVLLRDAARVLELEPDFSRWPFERPLDLGIVGLYPDGSECAYEVRAVFSDHRGGMVEDPVTGSLNASVAQWLISSGRVIAPYTASQGTRLGRMGRVKIDTDEAGTVWVGGSTSTIIRGEVEL